jgi:hypothetical protein
MPTILTDRPALASARSWVLLTRFFLWLVVLQGFHFLEHCVQVVQRFILNDPNGNGLLGNLANFEILHFGYNTLFLVGLLWVYGEVSLAARPGWARPRMVVGLLAATVAVQGYHEVEHVLRLGQVMGWLSLGANAWDPATGEPVGILGQWFNNVLVHWVLNGVVEILPGSAFMLGRFPGLLNPVVQNTAVGA